MLGGCTGLPVGLWTGLSVGLRVGLPVGKRFGLPVGLGAGAVDVGGVGEQLKSHFERHDT